MPEMVLLYNTRDAKGNDFIKNVKVKKYALHPVEFLCPCCHKPQTAGCRIREIVSSKFTDWSCVGEYVCENCADLFSLYFYNYIVDPDGIHLLNVRELRDRLVSPQKPPFLFVISTSQKKHLFYRSRWNYSAAHFAVQLEMETVYTTPERMKALFDFVECMQALGCGKNRMKQGEIPFEVLKKVGCFALVWLRRELEQNREIQIPLYCGQKREISEEDAICCINSTLGT